MISLLCAATLWINTTNEPWTKHDIKIYKRASHVCSTDSRYKDTHPCVAKFIKKDIRVYYVLCGPQNNKGKYSI